jgi:hypothetical protein
MMERARAGVAAGAGPANFIPAWREPSCLYNTSIVLNDAYLGFRSALLARYVQLIYAWHHDAYAEM